MFNFSWPTPQRTAIAKQRVIHIARRGRTLCGMATHELADTASYEHRYVVKGDSDEHLANCEGCRKRRRV